MQDFREMIDEYLETNEAKGNQGQKKLIIDMTEYPVHDYQPVSMLFAER